jgi:hypothetical protein
MIVRQQGSSKSGNEMTENGNRTLIDSATAGNFLIHLNLKVIHSVDRFLISKFA